MADRFFPNEMPDFVEEKDEETVAMNSEDSLMKLLSMPYSALFERLKHAGLDIKETVVVETSRLAGQRERDISLYCGTLGTAFLQFRAYLVTNNKDDLNLCSEIVKACDSICTRSRDGTFLCGRAGVCALGAVVARYLGDEQSQNYYLSQFKEINLPEDIPDELLSGRAGFLWACLFINKHMGEGTIPSNAVGAVVSDIFKSGRRLGVRARCPLMYEYYGEKYWGAAHGLAGIMNVLMHVKLSPNEADEVKRTLKYMIKNPFPSGNYPWGVLDNSDHLVHWCQGAPGMALTLVRAAEVIIITRKLVLL
ncbi:lanC-like protein GCL2 [Actinidia eriantha]|uniref:lanC-like protein GCL2 n=1 Tax=Actinidia eriantha TaxID=165200 RepID=UPI002589C20B|nr:lanC-like protein GCL2 [Actinidia eriantha]